jgi:hypothetical protein
MALLICIGLCTILLAGISAITAQWGILLIGLGIGSVWFLLEWHDSGQAAVPGMVSITILSAAQAIFGSPLLVMALVVVLALSAWDLSRFQQRLVHVAQDDMRQDIERRHLRRLLLVNAIGLLLTVLASSIQLRIGFYVLLFAGGLLLLAIYWVLGLFARLGRAAD